MPEGHDPSPDGRTGPWLRIRHNTGPGGSGYVYDARCAHCRYLRSIDGGGRRDPISAQERHDATYANLPPIGED